MINLMNGEVLSWPTVQPVPGEPRKQALFDGSEQSQKPSVLSFQSRQHTPARKTSEVSFVDLSFFPNLRITVLPCSLLQTGVRGTLP